LISQLMQGVGKRRSQVEDTLLALVRGDGPIDRGYVRTKIKAAFAMPEPWALLDAERRAEFDRLQRERGK